MPRLILNGEIYKEGTFDEGVTLAEFLTHQDAAAKKPDALLGFTDRDNLLAWAKTKGFDSEISSKLKSLARRKAELQRMTKQDLAQWEVEAKKSIKSKQREVRLLLQTEGVDVADVRGLSRLKAAGKFGSMWLFDQKNLFPPAIYTEGTPKLSWDHFNDRAESALNISEHFYFLFQHTWWHGKCYMVWPFGQPCDLGWFNNLASSVY